MAATVAVGMTLWFRAATGPRRAVMELPLTERRALYERTLQTLRASCDAKRGDDGLSDYCRQQADFILLFPECDAVCVAGAERFHRPTR
jgi:hypothetical protein